jgi:hypothetical protein
MNTSWARTPFCHSRYSGHNVKTLHKLSECCECRCCSVISCLRLNNCQNSQLECVILLIFFMEVDGCILPSCVSILQASSASTETSACAVVPIRWLYPLPSQVSLLRSACPALPLDHPHLPNSLHRRNIQDPPDCLC